MASIKANFGEERKFESFFTGNNILIDSKGEHFYCAQGTDINAVSINDGQIKKKIASDNEDDMILRFTITNDDELLIIAYQSQLVKKYNLKEDRCDRIFKSIHVSPIQYLKSNDSNTLLATGASDSTIKVWNLVKHYCTHNLKGVCGVISCILFHDDDQSDKHHIYCAGGDDIIHVFNLNDGQRIAKLKAHSSTVTALQITPDGDQLISVGRDKVAVVWQISASNVKDGFGSITRTIPLFESVESVVLIDPILVRRFPQLSNLTNHTIFATVGEEGSLKLWDANLGSLILKQGENGLSQDKSPGVQCLQLLQRPQSEELGVVSYEKTIYFYKIPSLALVQQLQGHIDEVLSSCWLGREESHLVVASNSPDLRLYDLASSKCRHITGHNDIVISVKSFSSDPYMVVSASKDCTVLVWKFNEESMTETLIYKAIGHTHSVTSIAPFSSCRKFFSTSEDKTLKSWSIPLEEKKNQKKRCKNKNFDTDSTEDSKEINKEPKSLIASITIRSHEEPVDSIAISPNDLLMATGSRDKSVKVYNVETLQSLATLKGHKRGIWCVQFSPVDQVVASSSGDATIKLWNLQDYTCIKTFEGHDCSVLNFNFLSHGLQLLSVGSDGNMKLWDCKSNECSKTIDAHDGKIWTLIVSRDESHLLTGGADSKIVIWRDITKEEQEQKLIERQNLVIKEQTFMNYVNKKKWHKALKMAILMESSSKVLSIIKETVLEPNCLDLLKRELEKLRSDQVNFIVECCVNWNSYTKNCYIAQLVIGIIIGLHTNEELARMPGFRTSLLQLKQSTEKHYKRYDKLVQNATFVDFFFSSFKIQ